MTNTRQVKKIEWVHEENFAICWDGLKSSVGVTVGYTEKSELLSNQQETEKKGSSETYTQNTPEPRAKEKAQAVEESAKPAKEKSNQKEILEWFIGFTEGDGSFGVDSKNNRVMFIITQKEPQVLYYIKKEIGFGKVYQNADGNYRYIVSKRGNIEQLIGIFNGVLVLKKTHERFERWVESYEKYYKTKWAPGVQQGPGRIRLDSA